MFFARFFKPKWQSRSPQVRREALQVIDLGDPANLTVVRQAAESDPDPINRQTALRRLVDVDLLRRLADADADATVREHAVQRLGDLIGANAEPVVDVAQRRGWLEGSSDKRVLEYVARNGADPHMRWLAAQMIDRESLYTDLAIYDGDAQVRLSAAQLISSRGALERVFRHARTRDKRVRAEIQARLDELAAEQDRPARLRKTSREICLQLEALPDIWAAAKRLDDVVSQHRWLSDKWQALVAERAGLEDEDWREWDERFASALKAADDVIAVAQSSQSPQGTAEAVDDAGAVAEPGTAGVEQIGKLTQLARDLAQEPVAASQLQDTVEEAQAVFNQFCNDEQLKDELAALDKALEQARNALASVAEQSSVLEEILADANSLLSAQAFLDSTVAKTLEQSFKRMAKPYQIAEWRELYSQVKTLLTQIKTRVEAEKQQRREMADQLAAGVKELGELLKAGKSSDAAQLARRLQAAVDELDDSDLKALKRKGVLGRLSRAQGQLRELKDWQEWASTPVREQLCQEIEALAEETCAHAENPNYDFAVAARRVREARQRWRGLGPSEPGVGEQLWERFNAAANRAYEPCQNYFDAQAQARDANYAARDALCAELETFFETDVAGKEQQGVDWRVVERFLRERENAWRRAGPVDRKAFARLQERFKAATTNLRQALTVERENNHAKKAALVNRAEKIAAGIKEGADDGKVRNAVDQMKQLQEQWRKVGPASQEKDLWQAFTAARETINGALQSQFDFVATEKQKLRDARITLCERMEKLAKAAQEPGQASGEYDAIKSEWESLESGKDKPVRSLDRRFNAAVLAYEKHRQQHVAFAKTTEREHLRRRGELCDALEALADGAAAGALSAESALSQAAELEALWSQLNVSRAQLARGVNKRFEQAMSRLQGSAVDVAADSVRQNTERKEKLALRWEILADIESPPHAREARMAVQVAQLAEKMTSGGGSNGRGAEDERIGLLAEWCATGPVERAYAAELNERFQRAYASLYQG